MKRRRRSLRPFARRPLPTSASAVGSGAQAHRVGRLRSGSSCGRISLCFPRCLPLCVRAPRPAGGGPSDVQLLQQLSVRGRTACPASPRAYTCGGGLSAWKPETCAAEPSSGACHRRRCRCPSSRSSCRSSPVMIARGATLRKNQRVSVGFFTLVAVTACTSACGPCRGLPVRAQVRCEIPAKRECASWGCFVPCSVTPSTSSWSGLSHRLPPGESAHDRYAYEPRPPPPSDIE